MTNPTRNLFGELDAMGSRLDDLNSYLRIAYRAILVQNRPLKAEEILKVAAEFGFLPDHLHGSTPHKTLNARLSEHILERGSSSLFFRTAPATYFLTDLAEAPGATERYKVFHGWRRSKTVRSENVLVGSTEQLLKKFGTGLIEFVEGTFRSVYDDFLFFKLREEAEEDSSVKQFVTFTIFHYGRQILIHRRGRFSTASELLKGAYSVGFGGHLNDEDFDMFTSGSDALKHNASRELWEELYLDEQYPSIDDVKKRMSVQAYINVDDTEDARHHIAVLTSFEHKDSTLPKKGELSINELQWLDITAPLNDVSRFDLWSQLILANIYSGKIKLN